MKEIYKVWKTTVWHNKKRVYEVSNYGNVKINGKLVDLDNDYKHKAYYRFGSGYPVHRIVAELFISNPDNKPTVDHIDTNTFNNRVDNLRWATYKEQQNNVNTIQNHINNSNKGKHWNEKQKRNISIGTKKAMANMSEETKNSMTAHLKGNKYAVGKRTEEQKQTISIGTKIGMNKPEVRKAISDDKKRKQFKWMHNGIDTKPIPQVDQQYYLDNGWQYGRLYCKKR